MKYNAVLIFYFLVSGVWTPCDGDEREMSLSEFEQMREDPHSCGCAMVRGHMDMSTFTLRVSAYVLP